MANKIKILIAFSLLAFIVLSAIQFYLIQNTYRYKISAFQKEIQEKSSQVFAPNSYLDSLEGKMLIIVNDYVDDFYTEKITRQGLIDSIQNFKIHKPINNSLITHYMQEMGEKELEIGILLKSLYTIDSLTGMPDTLISNSITDTSHLLIGNLSSMEDAIFLTNNTSKSISDLRSGYGISTRIYTSIRKWKLKVLKNMWSLITLALLTLITVIGIFVYTLRSWLQQKRINDITTDFINNITHEFKTPLASLSIASKTLRKDVVKQNDTIFNSTLNSLDRQNIRLQNLTDQVINKSLGSEDLKFNKEPLIDHKYFFELIKDFKFSVDNKAVSIESNLCSEGTIHLDQFYFTTAIFNLLDNAVKYNEEPAKINITTNKEGTDLIITIQDNGIGIPPNQQKSIFDKFYRINTGDIHNVKGLGLGLYYVKNIIQGHNGEIDMNSNNEGTVFTVKIKNAYR